MTADHRAVLCDLLAAHAAAAPLLEACNTAIRESDRREHETAVQVAMDAAVEARLLLGDAHPISYRLQFLCCDLLVRANDPERATYAFAALMDQMASAVRAGGTEGHEDAARLLDELSASAAGDSRLHGLLAQFARDEDAVQAVDDLATPLLVTRPRQARDLMQMVLRARRLAKGADHDDTLTAAHKLCAALMASQDYPAAEALARESYERRVRRQGAGHAMTQRAGGAYAAALFQAGRKREGLALQFQIYQAARSAHGDDHAQTRAALSNLLDMQKSA